MEQPGDVLGQRLVIAAAAEREQDEQVDVARAEQHAQPGRRQCSPQLAGEPGP
jgi:hypothetical protein